MPYDDDDDWTGTPPEGRHTRDQAKPDFWRNQKPVAVGGGLLLLIVLVLVIVAVAS